MTHLDPERLAQYALGDDTTLDAADQGHLAGCDQCRTEIEELRQLADLGHQLTPGDRLEPAPPQVWDRIVAELQLPAGASATSAPSASGRTGLPSAPSSQRPPTAAGHPPATEANGGNGGNSGNGVNPAIGTNGTSHRNSGAPTGRPELAGLPGGAGSDGPGGTGSRHSGPSHRRSYRRGRGRLVLVGAIAASVGLIAGVLGAQLLDDDPESTPLASTRLEPLKGKAGQGTAELVRVGSDLELRVGVNGLPSSRGFYEIWLINEDGKRMQSLGVLDPRTGGTFLVPADLTEQGYRIVDVSLEPVDGKPEHSLDSVVRGTLPA